MKNIRGCIVNQIDIADDFYEAYDRCILTDGNNRIVAVPAFTNGLFACELYLKILIGNDIKKVNKKRRHNLKELYNVLDDEIKAKVESIKCDSRYTLERLLAHIGDGFTTWRYCFENGNEDFGEARPFEFSDYFLKTYLPILKIIANEYARK